MARYQKRERYEVEWCAGIPVDENGDKDMDRADFRCEIFHLFGEATARARELLAKDLDALRCVAIHLERVELDEDATQAVGRQVYEWRAVDKWVLDDPASEPDHCGLPAY